jgi:uncharacterized membrane protein YeaQ/YmgE (transglycosylase-associated protein family)
MDIQAFANEFLTSQHGKDAMNALASQGIKPEDAQQLLAHAAEKGGEHVENHGSGLLGAHAGMSFFAAFAAGIVKGDGVMGAIGDGLEGVLGAKVAESIGSKFGLDASKASTLAAAATPFLVSFIKTKLG